jgi:protein SCO1/2
MKKLTISLWLLVLVAFAGASTIWYRRSTQPVVILQPPTNVHPQPLSGQLEPMPIEDFSLTDSYDMDFDTRDMRGQVWVASFFFATCPSVCRQQNQMISSLHAEYGRQGVKFLSITCDPQYDSTENLREYGKLYDANPEEWFFLTGEMSEIERIGAGFQLAVSRRSHSDRFVVIDKWGWLRGMYDWHKAEQMASMKSLLDELLAEEASPHVEQAESPSQSAATGEQWLQDFTLIERSGEPFGSQDLAGQIWVASFFFTTCASTCRAQNDLVKSLHEEYGSQGVRFVCISCDPATDTADTLREYAQLYDAHPTQWLFLTGDLAYIRRVGAEWFGVPVDERAHVDRLIVVDAEGTVRDRFDWHDPLHVNKMKKLLDQLIAKRELSES